jgi:hypothetical protein
MNTLPRLEPGGRETPPMLRLVENTDAREEGREYQSLDELAREGARRMLVEALEAEVASYLERHAEERDADGHAPVVRNGRARARKVTLGRARSRSRCRE